MKTNTKKAPQEKKLDKKLDCNTFCQLSRLDKSASNYLMRKYGDQQKTQSQWNAIVKKDRVIY